jgi:LmbE family N-acetylglucosaminyl deacetylase
MDAAMTAEEFLVASQSFPCCTLADRLGDGGLVVIAPHPDDESLGCGGLIAEACAGRRHVRVVILSDGTGSHPASKLYPRDRLRELRESESRAAATELGLDPSHLLFLQLPDRFVSSEGKEADNAVSRIVGCAEQSGAAALFVTWRHDPHCDHQAAYRIARKAQQRLAGVELYEYSIWGANLPPDAPVTAPRVGFRLRLEQRLVKKKRAIAAHRSQTMQLISDDPTGFCLSATDLAWFTSPYEAFSKGAE